MSRPTAGDTDTLDDTTIGMITQFSKFDSGGQDTKIGDIYGDMDMTLALYYCEENEGRSRSLAEHCGRLTAI